MSTIKLKILAISQAEGHEIGKEIGERELPISQAQSYFERLRKQKPFTRIMCPSEDSGYGLDNLGKLIKDGKFTFNQFGRLSKKEEAKNPKK